MSNKKDKSTEKKLNFKRLSVVILYHRHIYWLTLLRVPGLLFSRTEEMKEMRSLRPKNLARKRVAWAWASGDSIQCRHDLREQLSLHPFRRARQPLQLICTVRLINRRDCVWSIRIQAGFEMMWGNRRKRGIEGRKGGGLNNELRGNHLWLS